MSARARRLRGDPTFFERRLWYALQVLNKQGCRFRRQVPFRQYILDFADHSHRLVIELDGEHHGEESQKASDEKRDAVLVGEGYLVLRFANFELLENMEGVVDLIWRTATRVRK